MRSIMVTIDLNDLAQIHDHSTNVICSAMSQVNRYVQLHHPMIMIPYHHAAAYSQVAMLVIHYQALMSYQHHSDILDHLRVVIMVLDVHLHM